ncbi:MAG TPA: YraN family protein [Patescibacteria group bacterium]|nr:YraN family protein [Patescibacteria group bacterium]
MVATHIVSGKKGEDIASKYLAKNGYKLLTRNFRTRNGEVDIIALDADVLVFVEVKTRSSEAFGTPFEAITFWKMRALQRAAEFYKHTHPKLPDAMRIDVVSVMIDMNGSVLNVEHLKNATV